MTTTDWKNQLYFGDNLDILRNHVADASVDLIYLDPPSTPTPTTTSSSKKRAASSPPPRSPPSGTHGSGGMNPQAPIGTSSPAAPPSCPKCCKRCGTSSVTAT